jgi:hypothetical protein
MRKVLLAFILTAFHFCSFAQINDSILTTYNDNYISEKIYIHFDRSAYLPGETIWYKSYLMTGSYASAISKNFYADWYDEKGELILHAVAPVIFSTAKSQLEIPANYKGRYLTVKAYTQWMLNFDTAFIFTKTIPVLQKNTKSKSETATAKVDFLPEGGALVNGLISRIAFKAVDQNNNPLAIKGFVLNSKDQKVVNFESVHDGMGSFLFKPDINETYTIRYSDEWGRIFSKPMEKPSPQGLVLGVKTLENKIQFSIERTADANESLQTVYLMAMMNGQRVYQAKVNLATRPTVSASIPMNDLPDGVIIISVLNKEWQPVAERATFIRREVAMIDADVKGNYNLTKHGKNELDLYLQDTIPGSFSVAITDADVFSDSTYNIYSHLLLSAELRGKINNPNFYFLNTADSTLQFLDLVMLTNGWRKILWSDMAAHQLPKLWFAPDKGYLEFGGKVYGANAAQLKQAAEMNIFLQTRDSSRQIIQVNINPDGTFTEPSLFFFDTVKVYYQFNKRSALASRTTTKFTTGFRNELYKRLLNEAVISDILPGRSAEQMQRYAAQQAEIEKLLKGTTLEAVTVRARQKNPLDAIDDKYSSGLFGGNDAYRFNVADDPMALSAITVFNYLQSKVAGLIINNATSTQPSLSWRQGTPQLYLNEFPVEISQLSTLNMSDVAYIKVFRPPFFGATGGGGGGAIAVYTKKGGDVANRPGEGLEFQHVAGYTAVKQFYAPEYSSESMSNIPDVRATLYWNPYVGFDKTNKHTQLRFYNNDNTKRFRVIIEGMNDEGKLFHYNKIVESR